ncbi:MULTISPECIES: hypothetical protein [unclassified Fibrobacter]|uniref:hypothetical protein n=1 Tax=unclassified Fibrobacter TaxID=2634177 RepID=UPI0011B25B1C|nr:MULTISPECIES: hypothetical protein [unclassified Fibrobacter]
MMVRALYGWIDLSDINLKHPSVSNNKEELVEYGSLLDGRTEFGRKYDSLMSSLKEVHERRRTTPLSHPQDKKTKVYSEFVTGIEASHFKELEFVALYEITKMVGNKPNKKE